MIGYIIQLKKKILVKDVENIIGEIIYIKGEYMFCQHCGKPLEYEKDGFRLKICTCMIDKINDLEEKIDKLSIVVNRIYNLSVILTERTNYL